MKMLPLICFLIGTVSLWGVQFVQADEVDLPQLQDPASWEYDSKIIEVGQVEGRLSVNLDKMTKDTTTVMSLKKPIPVPQGSELVFNATMDRIYELYFNPIVTDSKGNTYLVYTDSTASLKRGMFLGGRFRGGLFRLGEVRMRSIGMRGFRKQSYETLKRVTRFPAPPIMLTGFQVRTKRDKTEKNTLYVRNFRFTDVNFKTSKFYYQFDSDERFGEIDGLPSISFHDLGMSWGEKWIVDWEVRTDYAGPPCMTGSSVFEADRESDIPMALQLGKRIQFPVTSTGVYWVRTKVRWSYSKRPIKVWEKEYRLYIMRGKDDMKLTPIGADQRIGTSMIRLAPERSSFIWDKDEDWKVNVRFYDAVGKAATIKATNCIGTVLAEQKSTVGDTGIVTFDLSAVKPGAYTLTATLEDDGKMLDQLTRLVGKKADFAATPFRLPKGTPSARDLIDGPKPLFHIMPHIGSSKDELDKVKALMDVIGQVSTDFEYLLRWRKAEPLPGVYDFSELDAVLDYAEKKGLNVLVWPAFSVPEWVPSDYQMNREGTIFGHKNYLFHGARLNMFHSPVIRSGAIEYLRNLVLHVRNHKAVQGYYYLVEHPGEAPYAEWYQGFDPYTLKNFRAFAKKTYGTIDKANQVWHSNYKSFEALVPPAHGEEASQKLWVDWLRFRKDAVQDFLVDCAKAIRKEDPHRLVMVYGGGMFERMDEFAKLNMMSANGGCERPPTFAESLIRVADGGIPQRAEEVTVTRWAADYPTRLDTSLFSMMLGGGANSSCKMFFPVESMLRAPEKSLDAIRKEPWALDRYEKFQPIWTELRPARVVGRDVRYLTSTNSQLLKYKTTFRGGGNPWSTMFFLDSQVPFGMAPMKGWDKDKLLVLPFSDLEHMEKGLVDQVCNYVENGGAVLMNVSAGRICVEDEKNDWYLLKRFGFNAPVKQIKNKYSNMAAVLGAGMGEGKQIGRVRHLWDAGEQPGKVLATLADWENKPGITVKDFGKGKVFVIWADGIQPAGRDGIKDYPMLRSIAEMCGVKLPTKVNSRCFWTNLLRHQDNGDYYLLVMRSPYGDDKDRTCSVQLPYLPDGDYTISELINHSLSRDSVPVGELRDKGIPVELGKREVAIFKLHRK